MLAITVATVGSLATSTTAVPERGTAEVSGSDPSAPGGVGDRSALGDAGAAATVAPAQPDVPVRSGRLGDEVDAAGLARPVTVRMPSVGVEAPVIPVGVDEELRFDVPAADTVGWYRYSAVPGAPGASVLAAHVDYGGLPGAFYHLADVVPGDVLELVLDDGSTLVYDVIGNTLYDKTELPAADLFRKDGEPVLQLITCGGTFDPVAHSYEANVVVTARARSA